MFEHKTEEEDEVKAVFLILGAQQDNSRTDLNRHRTTLTQLPDLFQDRLTVRSLGASQQKWGNEPTT